MNAALAVGARASHLPIAIVLAVFLLVRGRRATAGTRELFRWMLVCATPMAGVALALAWYNWIRFGNPLNFGYRYLLLDAKNFGASYFSPRYALYNLWQYLVGIPRGSGWFPFFEWTREGPVPVPAGYYSLVQVYGAAFVAPYCLVGAVFFRRRFVLPDALHWLTALIFAAGAGILSCC